MRDDDEIEYEDDRSLSPRSQLLSPGTVRSVLQRPRAPDAYSAIDPDFDTALDDEHHHAPRREVVSEMPLDIRSMRRLLRETSEKLEAATKRANKAEHYARDARTRTSSLEKHYQASRERNVKTIEELDRYKHELQIAQQQVQIAQDEINSLAVERDRAESDAARARDLARKATEQLKVHQAREDGKKVGFEEGRQAAMLEARAQMEEVRAEVEQVLLQGSRQKRHSRRRSENDVVRDSMRRPSGGSDLDIPGPSRHASLTPIPEAHVEMTPGGMSANLHMPMPYPMHNDTGAGNRGSQQEIPAFRIVPPAQSQHGMPGLHLNGQDPYGMPDNHLAPAPPRIVNSPVPPMLTVYGDNTPSLGGNLDMPAFTANIIPPTPQPSSPAAQGGSYFTPAPGMRAPSPGPMAMPPRVASPMRGPSPGPGIIAPSPQMASPRGWSLDEPVRPPSSSYSRNTGGPSAAQALREFHGVVQDAVQDAVLEAVESIISEPQRRKKKKNRNQEASGDVGLTITPASPDESSGSSSDDGRSTRTGKSTKRGADEPGMLSPRHIPRPPSRRSSPQGSRSSSPHVLIHDMVSGGPVRVSAREAQELLEQEELERAREADRQAEIMASRSPHRQSIGGLPSIPSMTPSSHVAPLPVLPPPPPIPVHEPVYEPVAARGKGKKGKKGARGRGGAATTQQREVQFPPSTGTSHIEPFIPPDPSLPSSNYVAAPHAPAYPAPVTPVGGHRPLGAPGYAPSPGSGPFPLPSLIPDGPVIPADPGMSSRPTSRHGGMPSTRPYEAAPGAPVYPPPLTPGRSQLAMGASPAGSHRSLSRGRQGEEDGATFTMPEGGWTWNAGRS